MSLKIEKETKKRGFFFFNWTEVKETLTYEGKVVRVAQAYLVRKKYGANLTLQEENKFQKVHMKELPLAEAKELLLGKRVRIRDKYGYWLGIADVEILGEN